MSVNVVHFFVGNEGTLSQAVRGALHKQGLIAMLHRRVKDLCADIAPGVGDHPGTDANCLVVFLCPASRFPQLTIAVRNVNPRARIVALLPCVDHEALEQAIVAGVDACWHAGAGAHLLADALRRQAEPLRDAPRASIEPATALVAVQAAPVAGAEWRLSMRGGLVHSPQGASVPLTTAEREIVQALWQAPERRLGHGTLLKTVDPAADLISSAAARRRLSVLVSRLRKKFHAAGIPAPVRSVRGSGYELSIDFVPPASRNI